MVRAWKIGELEVEAAIAGKSESETDPVGGDVDVARGVEGRGLPRGFKRSPFLRRMVVWQKV